MAEDPFAGLGEIGQVSVPVQDLEEAIVYYRDILGMRFLFQVPSMGFFECGGVRLVLAVPEEENAERCSSILYFKVPDIYGWTEALKRRGVAFISEPHRVAKMPDHELWMSFFRDVSGNMMGLMSEVR